MTRRKGCRRNIDNVHRTERRPRTRFAVIAVALVCLSACTPRVVDGQALQDPAYVSDRQNGVTHSPQPQQVSAPGQVDYPKTDHPTEHPEVGLGVATHPPTDFSLIPGN